MTDKEIIDAVRTLKEFCTAQKKCKDCPVYSVQDDCLLGCPPVWNYDRIRCNISMKLEM